MVSRSLFSNHQQGFLRSDFTEDILSYLSDLWSTFRDYGIFLCGGSLYFNVFDPVRNYVIALPTPFLCVSSFPLLTFVSSSLSNLSIGWRLLYLMSLVAFSEVLSCQLISIFFISNVSRSSDLFERRLNTTFFY